MWTVKYISFGKQPVAARPQGSGRRGGHYVTVGNIFISFKVAQFSWSQAHGYNMTDGVKLDPPDSNLLRRFIYESHGDFLLDIVKKRFILWLRQCPSAMYVGIFECCGEPHVWGRFEVYLSEQRQGARVYNRK